MRHCVVSKLSKTLNSPQLPWRSETAIWQDVACSIICAIVYITTTTLTQVYSRTFFSRSSPWPRETTYDVRGQESNQMAAQGSLLRSSTNVRIMTRWSPRERTPRRAAKAIQLLQGMPALVSRTCCCCREFNHGYWGPQEIRQHTGWSINFLTNQALGSDWNIFNSTDKDLFNEYFFLKTRFRSLLYIGKHHIRAISLTRASQQSTQQPNHMSSPPTRLDPLSPLLCSQRYTSFVRNETYLNLIISPAHSSLPFSEWPPLVPTHSYLIKSTSY